MQQHAARVAVQRAVGGGVEVHCTRNPRLGYLKVMSTKVFICIARGKGVECDRYLVLRNGNDYTARLQRRGVDCIVPA